VLVLQIFSMSISYSFLVPMVLDAWMQADISSTVMMT
jgi:hypothetical protein